VQFSVHFVPEVEAIENRTADYTDNADLDGSKKLYIALISGEALGSWLLAFGSWLLVFPISAISAISRDVGDSGDSHPSPLPCPSQIGVDLSDVHPKSSQIGVDLTHIGWNWLSG